VTQNVVSMCCVLNSTALEALGESGSHIDTCLENGMCQPPAGSAGQFARNLCTDQTWRSPNCLNVCTDPSNGGTSSDTSFLTHCTDGSWCCGGANTTCCNNNQGFQVASAISPYINAASTRTGTTTSATGTGTSAPETGNSSSTVPPTSSPSSSLNGVAIGLGAALGILLLGAIAFGIFLWGKKKAARRRPIELGPGRTTEWKDEYPLAQVQNQQVRHDLETPHVAPGYGPNGMIPAEMDGSGGMRYKV